MSDCVRLISLDYEIRYRESPNVLCGGLIVGSERRRYFLDRELWILLQQF